MRARSFSECMRVGTEVFHQLKATLHARGLATAVGDEGGFAPDLASNEAALELLVEAIEASGYRPGEDVAIALDPATSEMHDGDAYVLEHEGRTLSAAELTDYWAQLAGRYPIVSIEDGMDEEDWSGWKTLTERLGERLALVGDDVFVTNTERLARGDRAGRRQLDPDQGQPDRHAHRDAGGDRHGARGGLRDGDLAPLRRDRGCDDRRSGGRDRRRADQDRRAFAQRPGREVQPAAAHRRGARRASPLPRALGLSRLMQEADPRRRMRLQWPPPQSPSPAQAPAAARIRWDRVGRVAMLFALVVLLYLAISPVRSLIADFHLSAQRRAQVVALQRTANQLAAQERALALPSTRETEARNLGLVRPGEHPYVVSGLPNN